MMPLRAENLPADMQDGQKERTKKNLNLSILSAYNNPKRTFAPGGKLLKKFDQNF